jgi:hypothetical protein
MTQIMAGDEIVQCRKYRDCARRILHIVENYNNRHVNTFHFFLCHCSTVWICKIFFVFSNMIQDFLYLCILIPCVCIL